tara:strand:- start:809 stop:991 length:183 start_codon:yes stop_codon:yes gene_type:complete
MNYRELLVALPKMDEGQIQDLLHDEKKGARRMTFLIRLHQRFCAMRDARERRELIKDAVA